MLAVADILGNNTAAVATYSKRLILTALTGEAWGYMGSKRLLWEMHTNTSSTAGLDLDRIHQVRYGYILISDSTAYRIVLHALYDMLDSKCV